MKDILKQIGYTIFLLAMMDVTILTIAIAQIAYEGRTGYWAPFWRLQAEFVINLLS